ncbi:MAG: CPBP family intramembrane metalloprotease [Lachnospiraceae bacterium]|nr:CPBP family intramembrane metalloprotease [Lachnospiraceae bacterium]
MNSIRKEAVRIYFVFVFGLPIILGIFMWIAYANGVDTSIFPLTWMYLPACGVMIAMFLTKKDCEHPLPTVFYCTFSAVTIIMVILCVVSVIVTQTNLAILSNVLVMLSCPICLVEIICMKKEKRGTYGLSFVHNLKRSVMGIVTFLGLYFTVCLLSFIFESLLLGKAEEYTLNQNALIYVAVMPLNFLLSFTAFFGEEYGWRYFLQPVMQRKFGLRKGVIVLGLLWGIWHLPIHLFYYSPQTSLQSILVQLAGCVGMGIFFGWVYMRTHNIWAVAIMHFINNNVGSALFAASPSDVVWEWRSTLISICIYLIVYLPFLLTKEYRASRENKE